MSLKRALLLFTYLILNILFASTDLHTFVQQITEESIRDYFYRSEDPSWDPLKFHYGKTREEGTNGHDSAKVFIENTLNDYLGPENVYVDEFSWPDGTDGKGYNIIGRKPGQGSDIWIVGAHYDSYDMDYTGSAPGANDNGSGLVGLLELARIINTRESDASIYFCAWDAEEPRSSSHSWENESSFGSDLYNGPSGSRAWVNDHFTTNPLLATGDTLLWQNIKGNLNLDMFGYPVISNTLWLYHGGDSWNSTIDESSNFYPLLTTSNTLYQDAITYLQNYAYDDNNPRNYINVVGKGTMQYSDNISFSRAGIASLEYAESDWNSDIHYHKWSDYYRPGSGDDNFDDENPQVKFISMVLRGATALLADTAGVNLSSEVPLPVTLTDFIAISEQEHVLLSWVTESELENLGFIIERRTSYDQPWSVLAYYLDDAELMGQGNSTLTTDYSFKDSCVQIGQHYEYRLSEVEFSGKILPLKSTSVLFRDKNSENDYILNENAYPNPFNP
ncbi:MAG: Zn-dependent exopeptidase M28, partial [Candidatus Marinimicrobia bacterium]|nr:Zn-dependent exopeptidase M28 [Candidatus Neomarinimicrobiota bacterium]